MIRIFVKGVDGIPSYAVMNAVALFNKSRLTGDEIDQKILNEIDGATWVDAQCFTDLYGGGLPIDYLSTGCKTALAVYHNQDKIVNCIEAGDNAISCILHLVPDAKIIIADTPYIISAGDNPPNYIMYRNRIFPDIQKFAEFIGHDSNLH